VPVGPVVRGRQRQLHVLGQRGARLGEDVEPGVPVGTPERAVAVIALDRDEGLEGVAGGGEECEGPLGVEAASGDLDGVLLDVVTSQEIDHGGGGEVAVLGEVWPLQDIDGADGLGDEKVQVRVALAMRMTAHVHGQAVDEERDIGAMVRVEPADQVLLGLAAALVLADDQSRHQAQDVGRASLRTDLEILPGDELLGR
jgi:hypothetical protein